MKKTKLLTSLVALALVVGLGACDGDITINVGDVDVDLGGDSSSDTSGTETSEGEESGDTGSTEETCQHEWGDWETKQEATCTENGYQERVCSLCGETQTMTIPATGHTWGETVTSNNNGTHTLTCTVCNATETEDCEFGDWADTGSGTTHARTCSICGYSTTGTDDNKNDDGAHRYRAGEYASDENNHWQECTMCGYQKDVAAHEYEYASTETEHWEQCTVCGHVKEGSRVAHTYGDEYSADERGHYNACVCGRASEITPHTFEAETPYDVDGYWHTQGKCSVCQYEELEVHEAESTANPVCTTCGTALNVSGLTYTYDSTLGGYVIGEKGYTGNAEKIFIPKEYSEGTEANKEVVGIYNAASYSKSAFANQTNTKYVGLPSTFKLIGSWAFRSEYSVGHVEYCNIPASVTEIGEGVWYYGALKELIFPENSELTTIGASAFIQCSFTEAILPVGVTTLGKQAFQECTKMTYCDLGKTSITEINTSTFNKCSALETLVIPATVTHVYSSAFANCSAATTVYFGGTQEQWNAIESDTNAKEALGGCTFYYAGEWEYGSNGYATPLV